MSQIDRPQPPADQGLSSLGLLMSLAGSVMAPLVAVAVINELHVESLIGSHYGAEKHTGWLVLVLVAGLVRSLMHRTAGIRLWRSVPSDPPVLVGIRNYALAAAGHTLATIGLASSKWNAPPAAMLGIAVMLMAWPVAVWAVTSQARFRQLGPRPPTAEDNGFEGLAVMMATFGFVGLLAAVALAAMAYSGLSEGWVRFAGLVVGAVASLLYRSYRHVAIGVGALRGSPVSSGPAFVEYGNLGLAVGGIVGGLLLAWVALQSIDGVAMVTAVALMLALMAWPALVRRFVSWRELADVNSGTVRSPSPDRGATALGWMLLAGGAISTSTSLAALLGSEGMAMTVHSLNGIPFGLDPGWWALPLGLLQLWAALELLAVTPRQRLIGNAWALASVAVALVTRTETLLAAFDLPPRPQTVVVTAFLLAITPAIATLLLINRPAFPTAVARVVSPAP